MTATISKTWDVFLSHPAAEGHLAAEIAESLESVGLATFHGGSVQPGADVAEEIWQALAECRALIAIVSSDVPTHSMGLVEIGAAAAWSKPVFLVINGPSTTKLPPPLSSYPAYPLTRLDEVIQLIRTGFQPLSPAQRDALSEIYRQQRVAADKLAQSPGALRELTTKFNRRMKQQFSGERLLSELIRMRKQGDLPRLRSKS